MEFHEPVLVREVVETLQPRPGDILVDGNVGTGGHSVALLEACGGKGRLIGFDLDSDMLSIARQRIDSLGFSPSSRTLIQANHAELARVLGDLGLAEADRIVLDLGASSLHLDDASRGFSLQSDGPLDMRYDRGSGETAAEVVNEWAEADLARLFRDRGEERWAKRIARRIAERRTERPFAATRELAETVAEAIPRKAWPPKIHPATRVFLALRVEVNREAESLEKALDGALDALSVGGRLAVITFQSLEDRTVKKRLREACRDEIDPVYGREMGNAEFRDLTRKPIGPAPDEIERNPRSRSAKLRAVERIKKQDASA